MDKKLPVLELSKKSVDTFRDFENYIEIREWITKYYRQYYGFFHVYERVLARVEKEGKQKEWQKWREGALDKPFNLREAKDFIDQASTRNCLYCGKKFTNARPNMIFCSAQCRSDFHNRKKVKKLQKAMKDLK